MAVPQDNREPVAARMVEAGVASANFEYGAIRDVPCRDMKNAAPHGEVLVSSRLVHPAEMRRMLNGRRAVCGIAEAGEA